MELSAAALAVGFGVDRDWHGVLDLPREDTIDEVLQGIQGLAVASDEESRAIALDRQLDSLGVLLGGGDFRLARPSASVSATGWPLPRGPGRRARPFCAPPHPRRHPPRALQGVSGPRRAAPHARLRDAPAAGRGSVRRSLVVVARLRSVIASAVRDARERARILRRGDLWRSRASAAPAASRRHAALAAEGSAGGRGRSGGAGGGDITPLRAPSGARRSTRTRACRTPSPSTPARGVLSTWIMTSSWEAPSLSSACLIASSTLGAVTSIASLGSLMLRQLGCTV